MSVKIIKMPEVEPITIEEARQHLRISDGDEDIVVNSMIKQAREFCEDFQNRKYLTQTLELVLDSFPIKNYIEFNSCSPIQNVEIIKYYDSDGEEHIFDESNYIVDTDSFINRIVIRNYKQWPNSSLQTVNGVRIRFVAGFGDSPEDVPETVKWAMILHMRILYDDYKPDERAKLEDKKNTLDKAGNLVKRSIEIKEIIQSSFILSLVNGVQASNQLSIGQKIERAISAKLKGQFFSRDFDGNYRFIADEDEKEIYATIIKAWFTEVPKEPINSNK